MKKSIWKNQTSIQGINIQQSRNGNFLKLIKSTDKELTHNILIGERLNVFPVRSEKRMSTLVTLKLSLFTDDMILYKESLKQSKE